MKKLRFEKAVTYIVSVIFGMIVLYLTAIKLFSICTIDDREITHYFSDNMIKNILIIIIFIICLCAIKYLIDRGKIKVITNESTFKLLKVIAIIFSSFCIWIVIATQLWPKADQLYVLGIASEFRSHSYVSWEDAGYMFKYPNQNGFVVFIYLMSKIIGDYNNIGLQLSNVVALVGSYLCIYKICIIQSNSKKLGAATFVSLCMFFPLALYVTFVYGTLWGLFFAVAALFFENKYIYTGKKYNIFISAVLISIAILLKNNYVIFLIAMVILLAVNAISRRNIFSIIGAILILGIYAGISSGFNTMVADVTGGDVKSGMPSEAWISMGMQEGSRASGWYNSYHEGIYLSNNFDTEATRQVAIEDIKLQLTEFKNNKAEALAFYSRKIASQWNNPDFECFWIQNNRESKIFMSGTADAVIYGKSDILGSMINVFHLLVLAGTSIFVIMGFRKNSFIDMQFAIIFIGGFLFHIIWEAKCQYTIVYFVLLIPYAVRGYNMVTNKIIASKFIKDKVVFKVK